MTRGMLLIILLAVAVASGARAEGSAVFVPFAVGGQTPGKCDPAYPTICLPSPPPDLDCGEIPYSDFVVLPPDPHKLDADKDGIGCESSALTRSQTWTRQMSSIAKSQG